MEVYLSSFILVLLAVLAMAVGIFCKRKPIQGSCGGISCASCKSSKCARKQGSVSAE